MSKEQKRCWPGGHRASAPSRQPGPPVRLPAQRKTMPRAARNHAQRQGSAPADRQPHLQILAQRSGGAILPTPAGWSRQNSRPSNNQVSTPPVVVNCRPLFFSKSQHAGTSRPVVHRTDADALQASRHQRERRQAGLGVPPHGDRRQSNCVPLWHPTKAKRKKAEQNQIIFKVY